VPKIRGRAYREKRKRFTQAGSKIRKAGIMGAFWGKSERWGFCRRHGGVAEHCLGGIFMVQKEDPKGGKIVGRV